MIRITIDNIVAEVPEGSTILEAAEKAGISIPALCHKKGVPHWSSCMVCMVRDKRTGSFVPSCSALAVDGMDIDSSGDEVSGMRKNALELLFSEHRAECEAPCRIVCPAGYNIPLMNRLLAAGDMNGASGLVSAETEEGLSCFTCQAYCENACRRKKTDEPISIRNIRIFIYRGLNRDKAGEASPAPVRKRRVVFSSRTGKLEDEDMKAWLMECTGTGERVREIAENDDACKEAKSCMHCDCRAAGDCRLRELAVMFSIKDSGSGKVVNSPVTKKINHETGLVFENAKCIKCGLCVRACEDRDDEPALCFINRGFVTIISEPLTSAFDDVLRTQADKVITICPTGALSRFK